MTFVPAPTGGGRANVAGRVSYAARAICSLADECSRFFDEVTGPRPALPGSRHPSRPVAPSWVSLRFGVFVADPFGSEKLAPPAGGPPGASQRAQRGKGRERRFSERNVVVRSTAEIVTNRALVGRHGGFHSAFGALAATAAQHLDV